MNKYDFSAKLKDVNGVDAGVDTLLSTVLVQAIGMDTKILPARKAGIWLDSLNKDSILQVDDVDKKTLITFIENNETTFNFAKAQILTILDGNGEG